MCDLLWDIPLKPVKKGRAGRKGTEEKVWCHETLQRPQIYVHPSAVTTDGIDMLQFENRPIKINAYFKYTCCFHIATC